MIRNPFLGRLLRNVIPASYFHSQSQRSNDRRKTRSVPRQLACEQMEVRSMLSASSLLADINTDTQTVSFSDPVVLNGQIYFNGRVGEHEAGYELWRYDPAGDNGNGEFHLVADITPGPDSSAMEELTVLDGVLYFSMRSDLLGRGLFKFDPAANGGAGQVSKVEDAQDYEPHDITVVAGKLYYSGYSSDYGNEVFEYDPSANGGLGAGKVLNVAYQSLSSEPANLTEMNGKLYFSAEGGTIPSPNGPFNMAVGREIWQYDPAANNGEGELSLVEDLSPGIDDTNADYLTAVDGVLYFLTWELVDRSYEFAFWKYDPSAAGGAGEFSQIDTPGGLRVVESVGFSGKVYFRAYDDASNSYRLFQYDPADNGGAGAFTDLTTEAGAPYMPEQFSVYDGVLYFRGFDSTHGYELWKIDPTENNGAVSFVADVRPGGGGSGISAIIGLDGKLYFSAITDVNGVAVRNAWRIDLANGQTTEPLQEFASTKSSFPTKPVLLDGILYFTAYNVATGFELWQYDPAANGGQGAASMVVDIDSNGSGSRPQALTVLDGKLYFFANHNTLNEALWSFDPVTQTATQETKLNLLAPGDAESTLELVALDGKLYFSSLNYPYGYELTSYDPAANDGAGELALAADVYPGTTSDSSQPRKLTVWNGRLYFQATSDEGREPWVYDPVTMQATQLGDTFPGIGDGNPSNFTPLGSLLYFQAYRDADSYEVWLYDPDANGGAGNVIRRTGQFDGVLPENAGNMVSLDGKLYFAGNTSDAGNELWVYDPAGNNGRGTLARLTDIAVGTDSSNPKYLTAFNGKLYFQASDRTAATGDVESGEELWVYDPKTGMAEMFIDHTPDMGSSAPADLTVVGDTLIYSAFDARYGRELFAYQENFAPNAVADQFDAIEDLPLSIETPGVLGNDTDINGDPLTASLKSGPSHGQLTFNADGSFLYTPDQDYEGIDQFTYEVRDSEGEASQATVSLLVAPVNDPAVIGGTLSGETDEDNPDDLTGALTIADVDAGENQFQTQFEMAGQYGLFTLSANGDWTYVLNSMVVQSLDATESVTDAFTVTSLDGTASETVVITIAGKNDIPIVSGAITGTTNEDATIDLTGALLIDDPDTGESQFIPLIDTSSPHGTFQIDAAGNWSFHVNSNVNQLAAGTSLEVGYQVTTKDGTTANVIITIEGRDDPASLSQTSATTQEDNTTPLTGQLQIVDVDLNAETQFTPQVATEGSFGYFSIDASGNWSYTLLTERTQFLAIGETASDTFSIASADGAEVGMFSLVIQGSNDAPHPAVLPLSEIHRIGVEQIYLVFSDEPESLPGDMTALWSVYFNGQSEPVISQELTGADAFRFTPDRVGNYEIRLEVTDEEGAQGVATRTVEIGTPSQVSLNFAENGESPTGTVDGNSSTTNPEFHEWQDVPLQIWMTVDHDVVDARFDFDWQILASNPLFGEVQAVTQLGRRTSWTVTPGEGGWIISGNHSDLDLSAYQLGDRVLLATIWLPRNLEDLPGISMEQRGSYASSISLDGIELRQAQLSKGSEHDFEIIAGNQASIAPVIYDADDDGRVALSDFSGFVQNFGKFVNSENSDAFRYDYDRNGQVSLSDFTYFVQYFGYRKDIGVANINMPYLTTHPVASEAMSLEGEPLAIVPAEVHLSSESTTLASSPRWTATGELYLPSRSIPQSFSQGGNTTSSVVRQSVSTPVVPASPREDYRLIDVAFQDEATYVFHWEEEDLSEEDTPENDLISS